MGLLDSLYVLSKTTDAKNEGKKLAEALTNAEYRKNVFRNDNQRLAAFLFHKAHEIRKEFSSKLRVLEKLEF